MFNFFNSYLLKVNGQTISTKNVKEWLTKVREVGLDTDSKSFFDQALENYSALETELRLTYTHVDVMKEKELIKLVEKERNVAVMCDKGMGISIFGLDLMKEADKKLMDQLGARRRE